METHPHQRPFVVISGLVLTALLLGVLGLGIGDHRTQLKPYDTAFSALPGKTRSRRLTERHLNALPVSIQRWVKHVLPAGNGVLPKGARLSAIGVYRSDLTNPWMTWQGRLDHFGPLGYYWRAHLKMGPLPVSAFEAVTKVRAGSAMRLFGAFPLAGGKGETELAANSARSVLESVLMPWLLVSHPVSWRQGKRPDEAAFVMKGPDGVGRRVQIRVSPTGWLRGATVDRLWSGGPQELQKPAPFSLRPLGKWKRFSGIALPQAVTLGWHGVFDANSLPYPDVEKPGADGFVEVFRYRITGVTWVY